MLSPQRRRKILAVTVKKPRTVKGFATLYAQLAAEKLAENIQILDLTKVESAPADYFVICTCQSDTQVRAVAGIVEQGGKEAGSGIPRSEGWDSQWIIIDFFDVVVHVMHHEARDFYKLEKMWSDAEFSILNEKSNIVPLKGPTKTSKKSVEIVTEEE